jgi:pimeloyl-ACP methyl ester carboxylesterase
VAHLLSDIERAQTYEEYLGYKAELGRFPLEKVTEELGFTLGAVPEAQWHVHDPEHDYFWDPMAVIERTTIPVLAVFGELDTQVDPIQGAEAYGAALAQAGNEHSRVELIPGTDHNIILSRTGCLSERNRRPAFGWRDYPEEYLNLIEEWLGELDL